jgi:hypothetical protein
MVALSTWVILVGVVLVFWPVPPIATTVLGIIVIILGAILRIFEG